MPEFLALFFISLGAVAGIAAAINYFMRTGLRRALGYAAFAVCIFLIFWASGLWEGASRHSWGALMPMFLLMLALGWLGVLVLLRIGRVYLEKKRKGHQKKPLVK